MAEDNKDQKTEEPSPKRITDTEEKGNFAHSREINSSFVLLAALLGFLITGEQSTRNLMGSWHMLIAEAGTLQLTFEELYKVVADAMTGFIKVIGPFLVPYWPYVTSASLAAPPRSGSAWKRRKRSTPPGSSRRFPGSTGKKAFASSSSMQRLKSSARDAVWTEIPLGIVLEEPRTSH